MMMMMARMCPPAARRTHSALFLYNCVCLTLFISLFAKIGLLRQQNIAYKRVKLSNFKKN